jgi:DNA-binding beta-propeller fold protein YncE
MTNRGFATSEADATVTVLDLDHHQAIATFPAGPVAHAMALTPDGGRLYVVNRRGGCLTVVDARAPALLGTIPLSADPMAAAVSPDGRLLAVLARAELRAWVLDAATGALLHEVPLATDEPITAGSVDEQQGGPASTHPVWAADGVTFYAEDNRAVRLLRVDAAAGNVVGAAHLPSPVHMVYTGKGDTRVFALCGGNPSAGIPPSVAVLDSTLDAMTADVPIPLARGETGELHHAAFDTDGRRLFVANMGTGRPRGGHSLHVLDTERLSWSARLEARAGAGHPRLSPDGTRLFVVNHSDPRISVFDVERLHLVGEATLPDVRSMGHGCFFTEDGRYFWVISNSAGTAYAVDTATLGVVARLPIGAESQDIARSWSDATA